MQTAKGRSRVRQRRVRCCALNGSVYEVAAWIWIKIATIVVSSGNNLVFYICILFASTLAFALPLRMA
jgi:hypothetical protein